ncbi:phosphotransferase [Streptomyces sp. NPDC096205]|uniref:phosphotransferase n=1 Tax=Streptomyces sp. NPDC096205 TaxID=3366081 RepID=UPI00382F4F6B
MGNFWVTRARSGKEPAAEPSADTVGIDAGAVSRWFAILGVDFGGPLAFERIGLGQSNPTYLVKDQGSRGRVLRRPPLGRLPASAHDMACEARLLTPLQSTAVPNPGCDRADRRSRRDRCPADVMDFVDSPAETAVARIRARCGWP